MKLLTLKCLNNNLKLYFSNIVKPYIKKRKDSYKEEPSYSIAERKYSPVVSTINNPGQSNDGAELVGSIINGRKAIIQRENGNIILGIENEKSGNRVKIFLSKDNGRTFEPKCLLTSSSFYGLFEFKDRVFAMASGGVFRVSYDDGETWETYTPSFSLTGLTQSNYLKVSENEFYLILTTYTSGYSSEVYLTKNKGDSWVSVFSLPYNSNADGTINCLEKIDNHLLIGTSRKGIFDIEFNNDELTDWTVHETTIEDIIYSSDYISDNYIGDIKQISDNKIMFSNGGSGITRAGILNKEEFFNNHIISRQNFIKLAGTNEEFNSYLAGILKLDNGRIIVGNRSFTPYYKSGVIYSDDEGEHWKKAKIANEGYRTQVEKFIKLENGEIIASSDTPKSTTENNVYLSVDNGSAWSKLFADNSNVTAICDYVVLKNDDIVLVQETSNNNFGKVMYINKGE